MILCCYQKCENNCGFLDLLSLTVGCFGLERSRSSQLSAFLVVTPLIFVCFFCGLYQIEAHESSVLMMDCSLKLRCIWLWFVEFYCIFLSSSLVILFLVVT